MRRSGFVWIVIMAVALYGCQTGGGTIRSTPATKPEVSPDEVAAPGAIPTSAEHASATPRPTLVPDAWMSLPVVPVISDTARAIYQRGIAAGTDPQAFSKVGDCQSSTDFFLVDFDHPGAYSLGDKYAHLQETIDYYHGSFSRQSMAVKDGFNVAAVLSPLRSDPLNCRKGETPLSCELRLNKPSVVLVSMETNFNQSSADKYGRYMRQIVAQVIEAGAVPILATKADNLEGDNSINAMIAEIANENDIPLWNFWAAAHPLPHHGLDSSLNDGFHISFARNFFDDPTRMESAWPWRNLTALEVLDAVRRGVAGGQ